MFAKKFLEGFSNVNVLIVGDVMLDRYWWGSVSRISPEAPVPVVNLDKTSLTAGGAANVAANVAGLGAKPFLIGLTGQDKEADLLTTVLKENNISSDFLIKSTNHCTTVKTRVVAHNQQVVRIDQESKSPLSIKEETNLREMLENLMDKVQVVIVSDYDKGVISTELVSRLITQAGARFIPVLIDPKGKTFQKYKKATILTPNRFEVAEVEHLENYGQESIEKVGRNLLKKLSLKALLITQGEDGMTLFEDNGNINHIPVTARNVYDVTGAGDTVIASLAVAIGNKTEFLEAAKFANKAAGLVVEQVGTTAISTKMLKLRLK